MKAVRCPVGLNPQVVELAKFEDMQRNVGTEARPAHVTKFAVGSMYECWCDEDGELLALPFNRRVNGAVVLGTFVLARKDFANEFIGEMTHVQAELLIKMVKGWKS